MCECGNDKLVSVQGKTSDMCMVQYEGKEADANGYVPSDLQIGGGDYLDFEFCPKCGRIKGKFPIPDEILEGTFYTVEEDEDFPDVW